MRYFLRHEDLTVMNRPRHSIFRKFIKHGIVVSCLVIQLMFVRIFSQVPATFDSI